MPQTRNFSDEEMRQLGGDSVAGFFPCDHHIEPSPTPTSSVHANPDIVIDAVGSPEGCTEIALACCNAAMSKMPSFALFEDARSILVKRLIPPPRYGFRHGINLEGLSVPRTALYAHVTSAHHFGIITHCLRYELMFCNTDSDELVNLVSDAGGISCLLQDAVHLATTVALPLVQRQMQVSKTASAHPRRKLYCTIFCMFLTPTVLFALLSASKTLPPAKPSKHPKSNPSPRCCPLPLLQHTAILLSFTKEKNGSKSLWLLWNTFTRLLGMLSAAFAGPPRSSRASSHDQSVTHLVQLEHWNHVLV